jgi:hypothetical protein
VEGAENHRQLHHLTLGEGGSGVAATDRPEFAIDLQRVFFVFFSFFSFLLIL